MDITAASTLFAWLDRELWLVTAQNGPERSGLIATSVSQATIVADFPRVLVGLSRQHYTSELVAASRSFVLHLLGVDNLDWVWHFGLESGRNQDKFAGLTPGISPTGNPVLAEAVGWLDCRVEEELDGGDRIIYLAEVIEGRVTAFRPPLTSRRLLELAPAHHLAEMKRQRHHHGQDDSMAIQTWRRRQQ